MAQLTADLRMFRLKEEYVIGDFDCGNQDLNDFLLNEAKLFSKYLLSVTYIIEQRGDVVAFFSLSNDKISIPDSDKSTWRKIKSKFPHRKHRSDYPAVKIGRLGVAKQYHNQNIGTVILNAVQTMYVEENRAGCTFITVDALKEAVPFYLKNGFKFLKKSEENDGKETSLLYFNLTSLS